MDDKDSLDFIASEVQKYSKSLQEEFSMIRTDDVSSQAALVKKKLAAKLLDFSDTVIEVAENGESDSVRLAAAKFGITFVLGGKLEDAEDPFSKQLKKLMKQESEK